MRGAARGDRARGDHGGRGRGGQLRAAEPAAGQRAERRAQLHLHQPPGRGAAHRSQEVQAVHYHLDMEFNIYKGLVMVFF